MPKKRKKIDWEAIEPKYRSGKLTNTEIARQHNCTEGAIRRQAKKRGWKKNLASKIRQCVREKIIRGDSEKSYKHDEEAIKDGANKTFHRITVHRKHIKQQFRILEKTSGILDKRIPAEDPGEDKLPYRDVKDIAMTQRYITQALKELVEIDRKAHGIDIVTGDEDAPDSITINYRKTE